MWCRHVGPSLQPLLYPIYLFIRHALREEEICSQCLLFNAFTLQLTLEPWLMVPLLTVAINNILIEAPNPTKLLIAAWLQQSFSPPQGPCSCAIPPFLVPHLSSLNTEYSLKSSTDCRHLTLRHWFFNHFNHHNLNSRRGCAHVKPPSYDVNVLGHILDPRVKWMRYHWWW